MLLLRGTAIERPGAGRGRPPGPARINHVLAVVREFFKHAVADGTVDGSVLAALYEVADDRFLPAELRPEGRGLRYRARPRHRLRTARPARPEAATQGEWEALLEAAACWRDRFVLVLLWFGGLRIGEVLGLRRADLHFTGSSTSLGCREPGPHLHVVHRDTNPNRASAKSRDDRVVPVGAWVLAYYDRYAEERLACPAADRCDFVLVNLFHPPLGAPMTASSVRQWFRGLSRRAGLPRPIHPHMLRHSAGTEIPRPGSASKSSRRCSATGRSPRPRRMSTRARRGRARRSRRSRRSASTGGHNDAKETPGEPRRERENSNTLEPARPARRARPPDRLGSAGTAGLGHRHGLLRARPRRPGLRVHRVQGGLL